MAVKFSNDLFLIMLNQLNVISANVNINYKI